MKDVKSGAFKDGGISDGFIILTANDKPMKSISDLQDAVKSASTSKNPVLFITGIWPSGKTDYKAISEVRKSRSTEVQKSSHMLK